MRHKQPLAALALVACCVTIVALCLAVVAPLLHGAAGRAAVQRDASQEDVVVVSDTSAADDGEGSGEASPSDAAQAADGAGVSSPRQTGMPSDWESSASMLTSRLTRSRSSATQAGCMK